VIEVIEFSAQPITDRFGFKIFKDMLNRYHYKRLQSSSALLKRDLNWYDSVIELTDASGLPEPDKNKNVPGIIFINSERIEYFIKQGNTLRQIRRGTLGTGTPMVHVLGSEVFDQNPQQNIPYKDSNNVQTHYGDGTTQEFDLNYIPSVTSKTVVVGNTWYRNEIPETYGQCDEIEVFVGGRRLRKTPIKVNDNTIDMDSAILRGEIDA
jgi:hypothetical protein